MKLAFIALFYFVLSISNGQLVDENYENENFVNDCQHENELCDRYLVETDFEDKMTEPHKQWIEEGETYLLQDNNEFQDDISKILKQLINDCNNFIESPRITENYDTNYVKENPVNGCVNTYLDAYTRRIPYVVGVYPEWDEKIAEFKKKWGNDGQKYLSQKGIYIHGDISKQIKNEKETNNKETEGIINNESMARRNDKMKILGYTNLVDELLKPHDHDGRRNLKLDEIQEELIQRRFNNIIKQTNRRQFNKEHNINLGTEKNIINENTRIKETDNTRKTNDNNNKRRKSNSKLDDNRQELIYKKSNKKEDWDNKNVLSRNYEKSEKWPIKGRTNETEGTRKSNREDFINKNKMTRRNNANKPKEYTISAKELYKIQANNEKKDSNSKFEEYIKELMDAKFKNENDINLNTENVLSRNSAGISELNNDDNYKIEKQKTTINEIKNRKKFDDGNSANENNRKTMGRPYDNNKYGSSTWLNDILNNNRRNSNFKFDEIEDESLRRTIDKGKISNIDLEKNTGKLVNDHYIKIKQLEKSNNYTKDMARRFNNEKAYKNWLEAIKKASEINEKYDDNPILDKNNNELMNIFNDSNNSIELLERAEIDRRNENINSNPKLDDVKKDYILLNREDLNSHNYRNILRSKMRNNEKISTGHDNEENNNIGSADSENLVKMERRTNRKNIKNDKKKLFKILQIDEDTDNYIP